MPQPAKEPGITRTLLLVAIFAGLCCFGVVALLTNIIERKQEGRSPILKVVKIDDDTSPCTYRIGGGSGEAIVSIP